MCFFYIFINMEYLEYTQKQSFNLCTEYSQYFILYRNSILNVLPILKFLAFGISSFEVPATQCFLDQHMQSSQSQPHSVSFVNMCEAHTDSHTMVLSSTYVKLTIMTMQCSFLQLKPEPFHANLITCSCECSPM